MRIDKAKAIAVLAGLFRNKKAALSNQSFAGLQELEAAEVFAQVLSDEAKDMRNLHLKAAEALGKMKIPLDARDQVL